MDDASYHITVYEGMDILHHQQYHKEEEDDGGVDLFPIPVVVGVVHIGGPAIVHDQQDAHTGQQDAVFLEV